MELTKFRKLIKRRGSQARKRRFFVFDVETGTVDKHGNITYSLGARPEKLLYGVIYSEGFCRVIVGAENFKKEFLHKRYKGCIIYAHNAEYDLTAVYDNIYKADPEALFAGKFICMSNGNCQFADSYNLIQGSVKFIGSMLGLKKETLGHNLKSHISEIHKDVHYCRRDCEIVYKALVKLFENEQPCLTIGSLSLRIFQRNFLQNFVRVHPLTDKFFDAFYGGRTEVFFKGKCDAEVYDINSAYPYQMQKLRLPNPETLRHTDNNIERVVKDKRFEGMVTATIRYITTPHIPALPHRDAEKRLTFPAGKFAGAWCLNEFRYALQSCDIEVIEYGYCIYSEGIETPFKEFVNYYYKARQKTKSPLEKYNYKLFLNNLYGKLAQRHSEKYVYLRPGVKPESILKKHKAKSGELVEAQGGTFVKIDLDGRPAKHSVACWAAYITAAVRIQLHEFMSQAPKKVLYCDTDSTMVSKGFKPKKELIGDKLGQWKKEDYKVTRIRALKDYDWAGDLISIPESFDDLQDATGRKLKGVRKDAAQLAENVFEVTRMIKTRESFTLKSKTPAGTFVKGKKVVSGKYTKRKVLKDGKTKPLIL